MPRTHLSATYPKVENCSLHCAVCYASFALKRTIHVKWIQYLIIYKYRTMPRILPIKKTNSFPSILEQSEIWMYQSLLASHCCILKWKKASRLHCQKIIERLWKRIQKWKLWKKQGGSTRILLKTVASNCETVQTYSQRTDQEDFAGDFLRKET